jgi:4a-hydroxytetrahydrobiopterin dehydratase
MTTPLTQAKITKALEGLPGWSREGEGLVKTFTFESFPAALSFMVRVGCEAEAMNHHPEWTNVYNRVAVRLNTHEAGGKITAKDVELAGRMEVVARLGVGA